MNAQQMADRLNEWLKKDPRCLTQVFMAEHPCHSRALRDDEHVIVTDANGLRVMGLLNGLLLAAGEPEVLVQTEDDDVIVRFRAAPRQEFGHA